MERRNKIGLSYFCAFWVGGGRGFLLDNFRVDLTADTGRTWIFPRATAQLLKAVNHVWTHRDGNAIRTESTFSWPYLVPRSPATTTFHLLFDRFKSDVTRRLSCTRHRGFPFLFTVMAIAKITVQRNSRFWFFIIIPPNGDRRRRVDHYPLKYSTNERFDVLPTISKTTVFRKRYTSTWNSWVFSEKRINITFFTSGRRRRCFY